MMRTAFLCMAVSVLWLVSGEQASGSLALPGDFNNDGVVTHADYSVLGNQFGTAYSPSDFDVYAANYGSLASSPLASVVPLSVNATPVSGNLLWTFTFSNVN